MQEKKNKKREFWVTMAMLAIYIQVYKVFFIGFIDDIKIRLLIQDYTLFSNGNRLLYALATSSLCTVMLVLPFLFQYWEMSRQLPIWKTYHLIKYRIIKYPLNTKHYRKYCFGLKILSLVFYNSYLKTLTIIITIYHIFSFGSYPRSGFEIYSIIGQILGNITFFFTYYYTNAYVNFLLFNWPFSTQYSKHTWANSPIKFTVFLRFHCAYDLEQVSNKIDSKTS